MTWKNKIKKDLRQRVRDNPTPRHSEIAAARGQLPVGGECKVNPCNATTCFHNQNNQCNLAKITITPQGRCAQYIRKGTPLK
jgi:hypothetical protein